MNINISYNHDDNSARLAEEIQKLQPSITISRVAYDSVFCKISVESDGNKLYSVAWPQTNEKTDEFFTGQAVAIIKFVNNKNEMPRGLTQSELRSAGGRQDNSNHVTKKSLELAEAAKLRSFKDDK